MKTPTLAEFKAFTADIAPAARAVLMARAFAQVERVRVDAYITPIFNSFTFYATADNGGERITSENLLYLADLDSDQMAQYYAACETAHRTNGFTGPIGHCPALTAENLLMETERALIELSMPLFGLKDANIYGENRRQWLELIIGACLKASDRRVKAVR